MFEIKTKSRYLKFIIFLLFIVGGLTASFAWVIDSKKSKVDTDDVLISKTEGLMISLDNGKNFSSYIDMSTLAEYQSIELKDFSGDGVGLYSAIIDSYTKQATQNGWSYVRTDVNEDNGIDQDDIDVLTNRHENKTYYCFDVYFRSTVKLNIYLHNDSYVKPSTSEMNTLNDGKTYCLFLKRTCTYDIVENTYSYTYENEYGILAKDIDEDDKNTVEASLPIVYNRSAYNFDFDDDKDYEAILTGSTTNVQTQFSANYIAGATRVACISEDNYDPTEDPDTSDWRNVTDSNYDNTRLRLLWAPNPEYRLTRYYNAEKDSSTYTFDIVNYVETYYNSTNQKIGKMVQYPEGDKYYYEYTIPGDDSTESLILYVSGSAFYKLNGSTKTQLTKSSTEVTEYNNLIGNIDSTRTTNNKTEMTTRYSSTNQIISDNKFYTISGASGGTTAVEESVPDELFSNDLDTKTSNLSSSLPLLTLTKTDGTEYYEGKIRIIIWVEGTDTEASISLTAGNGKGTSKNSGTSKISFALSFLGEMVEDSSSGDE